MSEFRRFISLIAVATAVPMIVMPLSARWNADAASVLSIAGLVTFLGGPAHVSLTAWFYADPVARAHFREHPLRYLWTPIALIVGATGIYVIFGPSLQTASLNLGYTIWLLWHYQRQNWGIHSFVSRVTSGEPASPLEGWILRLAVIGGLLAGVEVLDFGFGTAVSRYKHESFRVGLAVTALVPLLIVVALVRTPALRRSPGRLAFLCVAGSFFVPVFLFDDNPSAFLTFALAHGLQYLVFMSYVANDGGRDGARPGFATLVASIFTLGVLLSVGGDHALLKEMNWLPLQGLVLGVTMAHFVVDAGIWRLRDEFPRRYMSRAFPFL